MVGPAPLSWTCSSCCLAFPSFSDVLLPRPAQDIVLLPAQMPGASGVRCGDLHCHLPRVQRGEGPVQPACGPLSSRLSVCLWDQLTGALCPSGETEEEMENPEMADLPEKLKHQLRHRELFLSRQLESLPATHIRYPPPTSGTRGPGAGPRESRHPRQVPGGRGRAKGVCPAPLTRALILQREVQRHFAQRD